MRRALFMMAALAFAQSRSFGANFADACPPEIIDPTPCSEWPYAGPGGGPGAMGPASGGGFAVGVPIGGSGRVCYGGCLRTASGASVVLARDGVNPMVTRYRVGDRELRVYPTGSAEYGVAEIGATGETSTLELGATVAPEAYTWRCPLGRDSSGAYAGRIELEPEGMFGSGGIFVDSFVVLGDGENGVDEVRADGTLQVAAKECFVRLTEVDASHVTLEVYRPSALEDDLDPSTGLYVVAEGSEPFAVYSFARSGDATNGMEVVVSGIRNGIAVPTVSYGFVVASNGEVSVSVGTGGCTVRDRTLLPESEPYRRIVRETLRDGAGIARETDIHYLVTNGLWLISMKVEDPSGAALTNRFEYSSESGLLSKTVSSSGLVKEIEYDSFGRRTRVKEHVVGGALPAKSVTYSYGPLGVRPHDPTGRDGVDILDDDGTVDRATPRRETVIVGTTPVSKTLRFVALDTSGHRIVEEVRLKDATRVDWTVAWDDPANRRTFTDYMPENRCRPCSRRPSLVCHADGRVDVYEYASGVYSPGPDGTAGTFTRVVGGDWFRTVATHYPAGSLCASCESGTVAFAAVPFKTTREVMVEVRSSRAVVLRESHVCSEPDRYERLAWTATTRDASGRETLSVKSDGTRTEKTYSGGNLSSSADADGVVTDYLHDAAGRRIRSIRRGHGARPDVTTDVVYSAADDVLARTVSAGGLCEVESNAYDRAGRHVWKMSKDGVETAWSYGTDVAQGQTLTTSVRAPGTSAAVTNTVLAYADGRVFENGLNGAAKAAYVYGPLWTATYLGPSGTNSPRWTRSERNALGDVVCEMKASFGGSALVTSNDYDVAGNLVSVRRMVEGGAMVSGEMYGYDAFGDNVLSVRDIDLDGAIGWTSDRILSNDTAYVKLSGDWWRESCTWSARTDGSAALTLMRSSRTRLTGLGGADGLASETVETDEFGGETVSRTYRDREAHTVTRVTDKPDSDVDALSVTVCGLEITNRTATGVATVAEYDALGRPVASTDGRGIRSRVEYDGSGRVSAVIDGAGGSTGYGYDALGRRTAETDPNGLVTATAYDKEGRIVSKRGATYPVDWTYDAYGEKAAMTTYRSENLANGDVTAWLRDEATGLVTNKVYADGKGPSYAYTPDGRMSSRTWARGVVTSYAYDGAGNRISTAYSDGTPSVACTYDRNGNLLSAITDGVATSLYAYAESGLLTNEWQNGASIVRSYDALGRPTGYILSTTSAVQTVAYSYDAVGRLASVTSGTNTFLYSYLPGTDLVAGYTCGDFVREVSYEPFRDLISAVTNRFGSRVISSFAYVNDAAGRRTAIRKGGEAMGDLAGSVDSYGYNGRNEVISARRVLANSTVQGFSEDFAYDPIGNRISATDYDETGAAHTSLYTANALNQYVSRTVPGWASVRGMAHSDANVTVNGNAAFRLGEYYFGSDQFDNSEQSGFAELETVAVLNGGDGDIVSTATNTAFIAAATETFTYDDDGNLTEDGHFRYLWNGENRMIRAEEKTGPPDRSPYVVTYAYDHVGRNVMKDGVRYIWDDYNIIAENVGAANETYNTWGLDLDGTMQGVGGVGGLLAVVKECDCAILAYDGNGNITEYVSEDGTIVSHSDYSSFGRERLTCGDNNYSHRFSTKPTCRRSGLVEYQMRDYMARMGGWMTREPMGENYAYNLYGYCNNDLTSVDCFGNFAWKIMTKTLKGSVKYISRKHAKKVLEKKGTITVIGKGRRAPCKRLLEEAKGNKPIVRHDPHKPGQAPHLQTKNGDGSHIRLPGAHITSGTALGEIIDFLNPISDAQDIIDIGSEILDMLSDDDDNVNGDGDSDDGEETNADTQECECP